MPADQPTPLASFSQMNGPLSELVRSFDPAEGNDLMIQATRDCEAWCERRLAPFTGLTETCRAEGIEPDELAVLGGGLDLAGTLAASYAGALGAAGNLVRKVWLHEWAPVYQDMWTYSAVTITLLRSDGGSASVAASDLLGGGPEADTGLLWFGWGTYLPVGSRVRVTYSGGYTAVPASLVKACKLMAASAVINEDDFPGAPHGTNSHDSDAGRNGAGFAAEAKRLLKPWKRF